MRLSENCSRVHLIVPLVARASYFIYAGLAIAAAWHSTGQSTQ